MYGDNEQNVLKMEGYENKGNDKKKREEITSIVVRAGKRTYFFDVRSTFNDDYYLTITESKKKFNRQGRAFYEKHKIFLYKEDFDDFFNALKESIDFIKENRPYVAEEKRNIEGEEITEEYKSDVDFDSLGKNGEETEKSNEEE